MPAPSTRVADLKNLGNASAGWLNSIGIDTLADLEKVGVVDAYLQLKERRAGVSLNMLWAMQGAVMNIHWNDVPLNLREELRQAVEDPHT